VHVRVYDDFVALLAGNTAAAEIRVFSGGVLFLSLALPFAMQLLYPGRGNPFLF
jgi:hypothetical protein